MVQFLLLLIVVGQTSANEWTRFGGVNGDFSSSSDQAPISAQEPPRRLWQIELGDGLSSLVAKDDLVYASYLEPAEDENQQPPQQVEAIAALRADSGELVWKYTWEAGWLDEQEAFGGKARSPQATPLIYQDRLIVVGFTGWIHCLDRLAGELLWKWNAVEECEAVPVQFGFSASPIIQDGRLVFLAGGRRGGLVAIDVKTGDRIWNVPCQEASYATPIAMEVDNVRQLVFVTRLDIVGVAADDGRELWRYDLPKPGQTNVPTPLVTGTGRLVVSGQGIGGTRELIVSRENDTTWKVDEGWSNRSEFFYCNWLLHEGIIFGCGGDLLLALDAATGERLARWRGFRDANLVRRGDQFLVMDGEGALSVMVTHPKGLEVISRFQLLDQRCWTPLTLAADKLWCRGGEEILCCQIRPDEKAGQAAAVQPLDIRRPVLTMKQRSTTDQVAAQTNQPAANDPDTNQDDDLDPIDRIVTIFEESGAEAAWKTYMELRSKLGKSFTLYEREELAEMAMEQGLLDMGKQVLQHAVDDLKSEQARKAQAKLLEKWDRQPSTEKHVAENGLVYLELGVRNVSEKTLQTVVRGPGKHPFSYGIPFPAGKFRIEKWPVGTKLYLSHNDQQGKTLLTVTEKDSGKVIEIGK